VQKWNARMSAAPFVVRKAAVLGAGVMGAQIAAHLVNADVPAMLYELPAKTGDPNGLAQKAIDNLRRLEPSPLAVRSKSDAIEAANYEQHLGALRECDLVIEAISERMDLKRDLYAKIAPHIGERAIFASNTSGLSINALAQALPAHLRPRFCGVHFFNPPRYMHLVELIPADASDPERLDALEGFLTTMLGKGVVRAKDTPNFIANRVGVFSMLATLYHAEGLRIGLDVVDDLTGTRIGRPKSATLRTADVVGLDTFAHVVHTMAENLPDDPWHRYYRVPEWLQKLIDAGALGQKTRRGVYQKVGDEIRVLDLGSRDYRPSTGTADEAVAEILKLPDASEKFRRLRSHSHPQAQFLWSIYRDTFHYCAVHLETIAHSARDVDLAIRWGFGWDRGPFEIWQEAGWQQVAGWIAEDIAQRKTMADAPLPAWVRAAERSAVHGPTGSYAPAADAAVPRSKLAVYRRQPFPDRLLGESREYGETVFENNGVRLWHTGDDIAIASFKSRMHTIGEEVLDGVLQSIESAERAFAALVLWQTEPPFSIGANLKKESGGDGRPKAPPSTVGRFFRSLKREAESLALRAARQVGVADRLMAGRLAEVEKLVEKFQATTQALRYCRIPTVAAPDGLALGGGCEFVMHCDRAVATLETYLGLVEAGVGLLPAGGGCKEAALRAAQEARGADLFPFVRRYFELIAKAEVARSGEHAKELGYLRPGDTVVMNRFELLTAAKAQARAEAESGYRPPLRARAIPVAGRSAIATFKAYMVNMREGGFISEHDYLIGSKVATVICGGEVEAGSLVDEDWLLDLERKHFMELIATEKTQARIEHMLKTGRPLRN
jgi:3-hydroxyacyl-CoA dehydrogenase